MTVSKYEHTFDELFQFLRLELEKSNGISGGIGYPTNSIKPETILELREYYSQNGYVFECKEDKDLYVITVNKQII